MTRRMILIVVAGVSVISAGLPSRGFRFSDGTLGWAPPITGHPFSAEFSRQEDTFTGSPTPPVSYKQYRDMQGREVTYPPLGSGPARFTEIVDPVAGYWYILDSTNKITHRSKMPERPLSAGGDPSVPGANCPSLGTQTILGVQAVGCRGDAVEKWFASDLKLMLILKLNGPKSSTMRQVTSLTPGAPPMSVFQLPADYMLIDEPPQFFVK